MKAKKIIEQLLARLPAPESAEQNEAVIAAQDYLKELEGETPITDAAIKDSFQTGYWQKVKADEMRGLERQLQQEAARMDWLDENMSPEECMRLFDEEIMVGKLRTTVDKMMKEAQ